MICNFNHADLGLVFLVKNLAKGDYRKMITHLENELEKALDKNNLKLSKLLIRDIKELRRIEKNELTRSL